MLENDDKKVEEDVRPRGESNPDLPKTKVNKRFIVMIALVIFLL